VFFVADFCHPPVYAPVRAFTNSLPCVPVTLNFHAMPLCSGERIIP
jgi:hypothetical protein